MATENKDLFYAARRVARKYGYCNKIAVEIGGKLRYMTEGEVRALQILAKQAAERSKEDFEGFCKNVVVYSNTQKRKSKYKMIFREDGCFENDFECGFFSACSDMAFEIL